MSLALNNTQDGVTYTGAVTASSILFTLLGGNYFVFATAADTTNVLSILCPDGTTYTPVDSETTTAFAKQVYLPPGSYKIVATSVTAVQGGVVKIPTRPVA